jgi:tetratricopeptide (TPR) repeat protein
VQEARQLVATGKYREALAAISKELGTNRPGAEDEADRAELLSLRGESLFRLGNNVPAADAFQKAAQAAADPRASATARANALVARKSPKHIYALPGGAGSIDVADPAVRKQAFVAMREEQDKALRPTLAKAKQATTLPPMFQALPAVLDLAALEYAANGAAPEAKATLTDLGTHALRLISDEMRHLNHRIDQLDELAGSTVGLDRGGGFGDGDGGLVARRGLHTDERHELDDAITEIEQIEEVARKVRTRARQLGFSGERWEPVIADTVDLGERARALRDIGK